MDFNWKPEQLSIKEAIIQFAHEELGQDFLDRDRQAYFSRRDWNKLADYGVIGFPMPTEYGGKQADILETMLLMEGLGYGYRSNRS